MKKVSLGDLNKLNPNNSKIKGKLILHDDGDKSQRFFNSLNYGICLKPHRHLHPPSPQTFVVIEGSLGVFTFSDNGHITEAIKLQSGNNYIAADIPGGIWHSVLALSENCLYFEVKEGQSKTLHGDEIASWAPGNEIEEQEFLDLMITYIS